MIARLHFISQETAQFTHINSIKLALEGGCNWIQLRVKEQPETAILSLAHKARQLCDQYEAKLIINDYPKIALACGADGLHLGLNDMSIEEARELTSPEMIIGGTANTLEDVKHRIFEKADYIGLGPLRYTKTKQKLSPILGFEGFQEIMASISQTQSIPKIIAIGGITEADVPQLMTMGIYGIAMSGEILNSKNPALTIENIKNDAINYCR